MYSAMLSNAQGCGWSQMSKTRLNNNNVHHMDCVISVNTVQGRSHFVLGTCSRFSLPQLRNYWPRLRPEGQDQDQKFGLRDSLCRVLLIVSKQ